MGMYLHMFEGFEVLVTGNEDVMSESVVFLSSVSISADIP